MGANAKSLPPVPLSDTCGRLCVWNYMSTKTLQQSRHPRKSLWFKRVHPVIVVHFIFFMYYFYNVTHHPFASEYTKSRYICKANANRDQNLSSLLEQLCRAAAYLMQR